jgi:splicing factor U2AF subunit
MTRQARRLYVGGIAYGTTEAGLAEFFNAQMINHNLITAPGVPVVNAQINTERGFAFLEFRSVEECTNCLAMDGMSFGGQSLKIKRPKDYVPPPGQEEPHVPVLQVPGAISSTIPNGPNKIYIGGLPAYLKEEEIIELLQAFGALKGFNLVKDNVTGLSKGYAFCEFVDSTLTDQVITGLNGMEIGGKNLTVQRASVGDKNLAATGGIMPMPVTINVPTPVGHLEPTKILVLLNMVTEENLLNDEDYHDILDDVREECSKFGRVVTLKIPRPRQDGGEQAGVGKIFVEYPSVDEAKVAQQALSGRKFADKTVVTTYLTEQNYGANNFEAS